MLSLTTFKYSTMVLVNVSVIFMVRKKKDNKKTWRVTMIIVMCDEHENLA